MLQGEFFGWLLEKTESPTQGDLTMKVVPGSTRQLHQAFDFNEQGMTQAGGTETERWQGLPSGGFNFSSQYLDNRFLGLDEKGVPKRPDGMTSMSSESGREAP